VRPQGSPTRQAPELTCCCWLGSKAYLQGWTADCCHSSPYWQRLGWMLTLLTTNSMKSTHTDEVLYRLMCCCRCCCCCLGSAPAGWCPDHPLTGELWRSGPQDWRCRQLTQEPHPRQHGGM
jgi:hypothetical protein